MPRNQLSTAFSNSSEKGGVSSALRAGDTVSHPLAYILCQAPSVSGQGGSEYAVSCKSSVYSTFSWLRGRSPATRKHLECAGLTASKLLCHDGSTFEKGTPLEREGRKATGLRGNLRRRGRQIDTAVQIRDWPVRAFTWHPSIDSLLRPGFDSCLDSSIEYRPIRFWSQ